jgi:hypothetical protein
VGVRVLVVVGVGVLLAVGVDVRVAVGPPVHVTVALASAGATVWKLSSVKWLPSWGSLADGTRTRLVVPFASQRMRYWATMPV